MDDVGLLLGGKLLMRQAAGGSVLDAPLKSLLKRPGSQIQNDRKKLTVLSQKDHP